MIKEEGEFSMVRLVRTYLLLICVLFIGSGRELAYAHIYSNNQQGMHSSVLQEANGNLQVTFNPPQYLPFLLNNTNGWTSSVDVLNVSSGQLSSLVQFFTVDGTYQGAYSCTLIVMQRCRIPLETLGFLPSGGALANIPFANQNVIVTTHLKKGGETANYTAFGDGGAGNTYGVGVDDVLYGPSVKNAYAGRSTRLYIQNTGSTPISSITVQSWDNNGVASTYISPSVPGYAISLIPAELICASGRICSVKVTSSGNFIAAVSLELNPSNGAEYALSELFSDSGASSLWLPVVKYQYGSTPMSSGFRVQNLGNDDATVILKFIKGNSWTAASSTGSTVEITCAAGVGMVISPSRAITLNPGCLPVNTVRNGYLSVTSGSGPIAVVANEANVGGVSKKKAYSGIGYLRTNTLYGPTVYNTTISGVNWVSGISLACNGSYVITVYYYESNGNLLISYTYIAPAIDFPLNLTPPANFDGSVKVVNFNNSPGTGDLCAGVVNTTNSTPNQDTHGIYNMVNR